MGALRKVMLTGKKALFIFRIDADIEKLLHIGNNRLMTLRAIDLSSRHSILQYLVFLALLNFEDFMLG